MNLIMISSDDDDDHMRCSIPSDGDISTLGGIVGTSLRGEREKGREREGGGRERGREGNVLGVTGYSLSQIG